MDDLERRLHALADTTGPTDPPADLGRRVRRRRRARATVQSVGGIAVAGLAVAAAFGVGRLTAPDVPVADELVPSSACAVSDLLTGPATVVQGEQAAQRFSVTLDRTSPVSCTLGEFLLVDTDGTERARAAFSDVDVDPGDRIDLTVRWDPTADCGTAPVEVRADGFAVGAIALPVCGDVSLDGRKAAEVAG